MAGVGLIGELSNAKKTVHRRQSDDLPVHVKRHAYFEEHPLIEGRTKPRTGYYIDKPRHRKLPVEFVTEGDNDFWVELRQNNNGTFYTNWKAKVPIDNNFLGWWNPNDPQHPDYLGPEPQTAVTEQLEYFDPQEEVLAGGIYHIATLQGIQPLSPQEPILPLIKRTVSQGTSIPVNIPPATATLPVMTDQTAEVNTATGAAANTPNINVIASSANGALKGNPPFIFDRNRQTSKKFLMAFQLWRMINKNNDTMKRPYSQVIVALSYMDGPKVDSWKEEQLTHLDDKVGGGTLEIDEALWDDFMDSFMKAFTNTNRRAEAYQELCKLRHGESLDEFFAEFKRLAKDSDIKLNDRGTIEILKNNLKGELVKAVIRSPNYNPTADVPWTFKEWETETCNQHIKWQTAEQYSNNRRQAMYKAFGIPPGRYMGNKNKNERRTTSQGGHHMDVDAANAAKNGRGPQHSEAKKKELMENNQCFYCEIRGHRVKDCRKKAADQRNFNEKNPRGPPPIHNRASTSAPTPDMTPTDISDFLKENMGLLDEDTKLSIVESLMPKDFSQAQN